MKQGIIIGISAAVACALGVAASVTVFGGTEDAPDLAAAPPPPETFAAVFAPCAHCHQIGEGARNTSGPVLNNIIGAPAAASDYPFSQAMRDSGLTWDEATLRAFLLSPADVVPGSRMRFVGLDPAALDGLMAFLANPKPD